jgi:hypothetical protein
VAKCGASHVMAAARWAAVLFPTLIPLPGAVCASALGIAHTNMLLPINIVGEGCPHAQLLQRQRDLLRRVTP